MEKKDVNTVSVIEGIGYAAIYFVLAKLSLTLFAVQPNGISLIWLPGGFAFYYYLTRGRQTLPWFLLASIFANAPALYTDVYSDWLLHTLFSALVDTGFIILAATLYRAILPQRVNRPRDLFVFLVAVIIPSCAVTALLLSTNFYVGHYLNLTQALATGFSVLMADTLGMVLIVPLLKAWSRRREEIGTLSPYWMIVFAIALACILASFFIAHFFLFIAIPALIFVVLFSQTLQSYFSTFITVLLYNALAAHYLDFSVISAERMEILMFSLCVTFAIQSMAIQQRTVLLEIQKRAKWQNRANTDSLTQLENRNAILPKIDQEIERAQTNGSSSFCLALIDIDHFKSVNDEHGHDAGDAYLKQLGLVFKDFMRGSDAVARFGGEEFLVLLTDTDEATASMVMERLRSQVEQFTFSHEGISFNRTISVGISAFHPDKDIITKELIRRADINLYQAKALGRNRVC